MAKLSIVKGTTSLIAYIFVSDSSVTTGVGLTGLAYNTASLVASYVRPGAARTAITLATQTVTGAFSSGGFVEVDATNCPGLYRLDIPDAALASGVNAVVVMLKGAANMVPVALEVELTAVNNQDAVRYGMTALPNANAEAAGGLYTRGTGAGQINQDANGRVDANAKAWAGTATTLSSGVPDVNMKTITTGIIAAASFAAGALDAVWSTATRLLTAGTNIVLAKGTGVTGLNDLDASGVRGAVGLASANLDTQVAALQSDTDNIQTRIPAALVSGRMDSSVGAMATDTITSGAVAASAVTEIQSGLMTSAGYTAPDNTSITAIKAKTDALPSDPADASDIATAFGVVGSAISGLSIPTATQNADALLNRDMSAVTVTNSRSPINALRWLRNKWSVSGTTLTVTAEDDSTSAWTATLTTSASADPITGSDPA